MINREYRAEDNPFTLQFSYIPPKMIARASLSEEIITDLCMKVPSFRGHFLTGVRGCGKSVMMAEIATELSKRNEWIVVDIESPKLNIVDSLARGLYRIPKLRRLFIDASIDLSVLGLGIKIQKAELIASNEYDAIDFMLKALKKSEIKLLVTIDEVTYCNQIADFSHALSSYARSGYEIYLLMTGLKENIKAIRNDKSLTFLYRAKEHELEPLNITAIRASYQGEFGVSTEEAEQMAHLTKGYSFAFQLLGYLTWKACCLGEFDGTCHDNLLNNYDQYLAEFSYDKIWSELPTKEREVIRGIATSADCSVKSSREAVGMDSSKFSVYRDRLIEKGLINGREYGKVKLTLPRFGEYALLH